MCTLETLIKGVLNFYRQRIKDALNAQTYNQFLQYAQQQFPGNFDQQAILIRQLQDQHYQQYIQQLAIDQRLANANIQSDSQCEEEIDNKKEEPVKDCNLNEVEAVDAMENNKSVNIIVVAELLILGIWNTNVKWYIYF